MDEVVRGPGGPRFDWCALATSHWARWRRLVLIERLVLLRARPQSLSGGGGDLAPPSAARVGGRQVARCAHLATTCRRSASRGVGARFALVEMLADWRPACLEPNVCSLTEARGLASSVERVSFTRPARCNGGGGGGGGAAAAAALSARYWPEIVPSDRANWAKSWAQEWNNWSGRRGKGSWGAARKTIGGERKRPLAMNSRSGPLEAALLAAPTRWRKFTSRPARKIARRSGPSRPLTVCGRQPEKGGGAASFAPAAAAQLQVGGLFWPRMHCI